MTDVFISTSEGEKNIKELGVKDYTPEIQSLQEDVELLNLGVEDINTNKADKTDLTSKIDNSDLDPKTTTGTNIAYVINVSNKNLKQWVIVPHLDCGVTPTLTVNDDPPLTILKQDGSAIASGDIKANKPLSVVRVGSNFFIRSVGGSVATFKVPNINTSVYADFDISLRALNYYQFATTHNYQFYVDTGVYLTRRKMNMQGALNETINVTLPFSVTNGDVVVDLNYVYVFGSLSNNSVCRIYDTNLTLIKTVTYANSVGYYANTNRPCINAKTDQVSFFYSNYLYTYYNNTKITQYNIGSGSFAYSGYLTDRIAVFLSNDYVTYYDTLNGNNIARSFNVSVLLHDLIKFMPREVF